MNSDTYIYLVILCIVTLVAIPVALTRKKLRKSIRALIALCPIVLGGTYYLLTREANGIYVMLMAVFVLLAVVFHPGQQPNEDNNETA